MSGAWGQSLRLLCLAWEKTFCQSRREQTLGREDGSDSPQKPADLRQSEGLAEVAPRWEAVNHQRVARLMREHQLKAKRVKKFKRTIDRCHSWPVADNLLESNFSVARPNQVWTSDITCIRTQEGWLDLGVFLNLFSRLVVGWAVAERLTAEFVGQAFLHGQRRRGAAVSPLVGNERGSRYASATFKVRLAAWGCAQSMSRKGNSVWDHAVS